MKKKFILYALNKKNLFLLIIFSWSILGTIFLFFLKTSDQSVDQLASKVKINCQNAKYRPTCYDKELSALMEPPNNLSMRDTFKVSSLIVKEDTEYTFCHVLGHKLASIETKKNPSKWKDVIAKCPSGTCSNGCIHGAFQERFRHEYLSSDQLEKIKAELGNICKRRSDWSPSGIEQGSCYHALGHLLMYVSNADLAKSVSLCKELAINESNISFSSICLDGVFMQIFQPLEAEDYSLIRGKAPTKENLTAFCDSQDADARASCWTESWPLLGQALRTVAGVNSLCSHLTGRKQARCYESMFYIMPVQFKLDLDKSFNFCQEFSPSLKGKCFAQVSQRLVQTDFSYIDKAIDFCSRTKEYDPGETCFAELVSKNSFNFLPGSEQSKYLCSKLPEKWQQLCSD
jgi:hypothetical protein